MEGVKDDADVEVEADFDDGGTARDSMSLVGSLSIRLRFFY